MTNQKNNKRTAAYKIALAAMFIAGDIILTRLISIPPFLGLEKLSFQFIPNMLCGIFLGPLWGAAALTAGDITGVMLNSWGRPIHIGIMFSATLRGFVYGIFLYKRKIRMLNVLPAVLIIVILIDLLIQSYWLSDLFGYGYDFVFLVKLPFKLVYIPMYTAIIYFTGKFIEKNNFTRLTY